MERVTLMSCPRCNKSDVSVQLLNQIDLVPKRKSLIWWLLIGFWWVPIKWLFLYGLLNLLVIPLKLLMPKKYKTNNRIESYKVCNFCGHSWKS